jgi:cytochrome d ubiquinol oxidase subunit II
MLLMHGAAWLMFKTDGEVARRGQVRQPVCRADAVLFAGAGLWLATGINGYVITSEINPRSLQPLEQDGSRGCRCMDGQLQVLSLLWLVPGGLLMPLIVALGLRSRREWLALLASGLAIAGIILTVGAAMFPMILPSSIDPRFSLTVWDSSSHVVLFIMLVCVLIFLPLILAYTSWVYSVLRGKVDVKAIVTGQGHSY